MSHTDRESDALEVRLVASPLADLAPLDVHALYKLRVDVFVAEQDFPHLEFDDLDADPATTHLVAWADNVSGVDGVDGGPPELVATLRIFGTGDHDRVMHLGRVCTAAEWRGRGIAGRLVRRGLELCGDLPVEIGAQLHLEQWYESFGFVRCGEDYLEGRIPHVPMRLDGVAASL